MQGFFFLAARAHASLRQWEAMALARRQMRSYPSCPASIFFSEATAWTLAGKPREALALYDAVAAAPIFPAPERSRAAFLSGALAWRLSYKRELAVQRWEPLAQSAPGFFQGLAATLLGREHTERITEPLSEKRQAASVQYHEYALALAAWMQRQAEPTRQHLEAVIAQRDATKLPPNEQNILEIWAIRDVKTLPPPPAPAAR